jgi:hypothetical protein
MNEGSGKLALQSLQQEDDLTSLLLSLDASYSFLAYSTGDFGLGRDSLA